MESGDGPKKVLQESGCKGYLVFNPCYLLIALLNAAVICFWKINKEANLEHNFSTMLKNTLATGK